MPLSHRNFPLGNKRDQIETLTQCKTWPQFVISYFLGVIKTLQLFEITLKHYSEAVCTLLLSAASGVIAVACSAAITGPADTWER